MESNFYGESPIEADEKECNSYMDKLMAVGDSDIEDLRSREFDWKVRKFNEVKLAKEQFEERCSAKYLPEIRKSISSQFDFDLVKLMCVMRNEPETAGTSIEEEIRKTSMEEINAVERLESFSGIDALDSSKITEALERKHGHIYDIMKNWYNNQMEEFNQILEATPQTKMRNSIKREVMSRYDRRFETLSRGIIDYMKKDSTAAARLFNEYTEVVNRAYEAQSRWDEISSGFGYVPITETERKYEQIETHESETLESIEHLKNDLADSSDTKPLIERIKMAYEEMVQRHLTLKEEISSKIDDLTSVIDRGNELVREMEVKMSLDNDGKAKALQGAQTDYISTRLGDMRVSHEKLKDFEDHVEGHLVKYRAELEQLSELTENSLNGNIVTIDQVRIQAVDLLSRFKKKMEESLPLKLIDPIRNGELKIASKNELYSSALDENRTGSSDNVVITGTTFRFLKKRILSQSLNLNLSIFYLVHKNRLNRNAVDNKPFSLSEFVDLVLHLLDNYTSDASTSYVVLISPTGFDSRVIDYLSGDHRLYARNLFIYAMDPVSGKTFGNKPIPDPTITNIVDLQLEEEKQYRFRKIVTDYLDRFGEVSLERISEEKKIESGLLQKIAEDLEDEKILVIEKRKNIHMLKRRN